MNTLAALLSRPETQIVEFKQSLNLRKEGLQALDGMINADPARGLVVFGIAPDRSVVGIEPGNHDQAQRSLVQHIGATFDPPIQPVVELLDTDGKVLLAVSAVRHRSVPIHEYDGRAFIREGSACRQLGLQEKLRLIQARSRDSHSGPWRCDRCGAFVGMLASIAVTEQGVRRTYECGCGGQFWPVA